MSLIAWFRARRVGACAPGCAPAHQASPGCARPGLAPFDPAHAKRVARWVQSDDELFALAPRTFPPLSARKVIAWQREDGYPMLYFDGGETDPCGYVELNRLPTGRAQWWLGHCLVAPHRRGKGVGLRMIDLVLDEAFCRRNAHTVSLVVFPDNFGAIRCYRRAGFSEHGEVFRRFATRAGQYRMLYMSIDRHEYEFRRETAAQPLRCQG